MGAESRSSRPVQLGTGQNFYLSFSILSSLPPTLRSIVYVESFTSLWLDFVNFRPVQFAPTLELLHLVGHAETDPRGQLSARDAVSFDTMRDRVGACTGAPSLDIKLEWVSNRKKSADELYEEIAERYKLLR